MRQDDSQAGFTLIEVLVAITLLAFLLIAGMRLSGTSRHANVLGRDLGSSSALLNTFVEQLRAKDVDLLPRNRETRDSLGGGVFITWKIFDQSSAIPYRQPSGLVLLNAKLNWSRWGKNHLVETSTLLTNQ